MDDDTPTQSSPADWYPELLESVAAQITAGHRRAITAANLELLTAYRAIGAEILIRQDEDDWTSEVLDRLAADLSKRIPASRSYSAQNLENMLAFANAWPEPALIRGPLARLTWRHHLILLTRLAELNLRLWYARAAVQQGWSCVHLAWQIDNNYHQRVDRSINNLTALLPDDGSDLAQEASRDPHLLDFLAATDLWRTQTTEATLFTHTTAALLAQTPQD